MKDNPRISINEDHVNGILMFLAVMLVANIVLAVVMEQRPIGFKLIPMWIILITLCMVTQGQGVKALLVGVVLCFASEWICYFDATGQSQRVALTERVLPVVVSDILLIIPLCLITSSKVDNLSSERDREYLGFKRRQDEAHHLLAVKKKAEDANREADAQEESILRPIMGKRALLDVVAEAYVKFLGIRFKREAPKVLEWLFKDGFEIPAGIVFEVGEDGKELKTRNHWGVDELHEGSALGVIGENKDSALLRWATEKREIMGAAEARREMALLDSFEKLSRNLFPLSLVIPVGQARTIFLVVLGNQRPSARTSLELNQLRSLFTCLGTSIIKIESKDMRPSFATFTGGPD